MQIYQSVLKYLQDHCECMDWPLFNNLITQKTNLEPQVWKLPLITCRAVGGQDTNALPAIAAIACMQLSIILVDDLLDQDPRGEQHRVGIVNAANLAVTFQSAGLKCLQFIHSDISVKFEAIMTLNQMMLSTAIGQFRDTQNPNDENSYWQLIRAKSSPFFSASFQMGALLGNATTAIVEKFGELGSIYGEMIQIHDDLADSLAVPANPDWILGRHPLPILFAQSVDHPDRERFLALRLNSTDPLALTEAQTILVRCGAISYCIDQVIMRHNQAKNLINSLPLANLTQISTLFDGLVDPIEELFGRLERNEIIKNG